MARLFAAPRARRASVNLGNFPVVPVCERSVTATKKGRIALAEGHPAATMGSLGRGWSPTKGDLGNVGYCARLAKRWSQAVVKWEILGHK